MRALSNPDLTTPISDVNPVSNDGARPAVKSVSSIFDHKFDPKDSHITPPSDTTPGENI